MHLHICSVVFWLSVARAYPSFHEDHKHTPLEGVPGIDSYHKITYPKYDVIPLGSDTKGSVPPSIVHITKTIKIEVPKPYKVEVPVPVPHPVHIPKPYPVIETKIVKVPHPVPVEVIKKVPVPVEVPKPYPVSHEEYSHGADAGAGQDHGFQPPVQQDFGGWNALQYGSAPVEEQSQEHGQH